MYRIFKVNGPHQNEMQGIEYYWPGSILLMLALKDFRSLKLTHLSKLGPGFKDKKRVLSKFKS